MNLKDKLKGWVEPPIWLNFGITFYFWFGVSGICGGMCPKIFSKLKSFLDEE